MQAYRDQYATLFKNGDGVVVLGISVDPDTMLAAWAREQNFPMTFVSDTDAVIGKAYGVYRADYKKDARIVFVVAPNGRITYRAPFNVMSAEAYTRLGDEVKKAGS
jgi:thioredoxin-dependent peroxiredoxin